MNLKKTASSLLHAKFLFSSTIIFAGSFVVNVLNYVFTLLVSHILGVGEFGEVTALFSLLLIVSVPASALTMLMTRQTAFYSSSGTTTIREMFMLLRKNVFFASVVFWLVFVCAVPALAHFLQIAYVPLLIFSILIPITLASALQAGTMQGLQEFFMLSKQSVLSALIKLLASLLLVYAGLSVVGVMCGLVLASLASWGYGFMATHKLLGVGEARETPDEQISMGSMRRLFSTILVTTLLLALLSNIDVLMAKHYLPAALAGQYAALSTLGKILIYGIGAFITVLLPMVSAAESAGRGRGSKYLGMSLGIITAGSVALYLLFTLYATPIVTLLFGARYVAIAPLLATFSIAMACISLSTAFINYFIAIQNTSFMYLLFGGIVVEVVLIALNHASLATLTFMLVLSSALLLALMISNYALFCRARAI